MDYETLKSGLILFIKVLVALAMLRFNYFLIQPELSNFFEYVSDFIHSHKYNIKKYKKVKISLQREIKEDLDRIAKKQGVCTEELIVSIIENTTTVTEEKH